MKSNPDFYAVIHGHTDNVGDPKSNKILAEKRAKAVKKYLVEQGINENKLKILSSGEEKPAAANNTEEGRGLNRRVEVLLLKNEK